MVEEVDDKGKADAWICQQVLMPYHNEAVQALKWFQDEGVERPAGATVPIRSVLRQRWKQIETIIRETFSNGINPEIRADFSRLSTPHRVP